MGGLPEVTEHNVTGIVVPSKDVHSAAAAIEKLFLDERLRLSMGRNGRERVEELYDLKVNARQLASVYREINKSLIEN